MLDRYRIWSAVRDHFNSPVMRNWSILSTANIFAQFLAMLAAIRLARILQPIGYGQLSIVQTAATVAVVIGGFGLRQVITRECARSPEQSGALFRRAALIQLTVSIPVCCSVLLFYKIGIDTLPPIFFHFTIGLFFGLLFWELLESIAFGHENIKYSAALLLVGNLLWVVFAWSYPIEKMTPISACSFLVFIQSLKCFAYYMFLRTHNLILKSSDSNSVRGLVKDSLPFYWLALLSMATSSMPIIFLSLHESVHEVGIFSAGFKLTRPIHLIILALTASLLPRLSRLSIENQSLFIETIREFVVKSTFLCILISFSISILRYEILFLLFGQAYQASHLVLFFLLWFTTFWVILCIIGTSLAGSNRHKLLLFLSTAHAIITIPVLWICAHFGASILAIGMFTTAFINTLYHWYFFNKHLSCNFSLSIPTKIISFVFIAMASSWAISTISSFWFRLSLLPFSFIIILAIPVHNVIKHKAKLVV